MGFRKGHITQTALLKVTMDIKQAIDSHKMTLVVLFDFSKAFDLVVQDILLCKLRKIGCSYATLSWFNSCLPNRHQAVFNCDSNESFYWLSVNSGIPR